MCGIAGTIGHPDAVEMTAAMTRALAHRGPDGSGLLPVVTSEGVAGALGHRRLAILDLSDRGEQPMTCGSGRWSVVFNGEIFNYKELRQQLTGVQWKSETDTEVLVEAIARWGIETALSRCIGMFALAIWDHREQELVLARDRVGEKPLVYFHQGKTLAFASELKALQCFHASRLNPDAVELYLALGYVPAPLAMFRDTQKLQAGHLLRFRNGRIAAQRWWFPETVSTDHAASSAGRMDELRVLLADAVRLRLRADVPIALALSGGIDSSVIACEMARQGTKADAFTVVFDQDERELPFARRVAKHYGLRHEVLHAEGASPTEQTSTSLLSRWQSTLDQYDEPFADSSGVASLVLAHALKGHYKVILNGDGGDEAFAGYRHYEYIAAKQAVKTMAAAVGLRDGYSSSTVYEQSKTTFRAAERGCLLGNILSDIPPRLDGAAGGAVGRLLQSDGFLRAAPSGALKHALWSDRHLYLANDLTHKMDMALSAYGIEGRAPLLDHRILEWAQGLEAHDLVQRRQKKVLLRQAYRSELPVQIMDRPKHGFGAPIAMWMRGPLRHQVERLLPTALLDARLQREVMSGKPDQRMWTLFMFAAWAERWGASW